MMPLDAWAAGGLKSRLKAIAAKSTYVDWTGGRHCDQGDSGARDEPSPRRGTSPHAVPPAQGFNPWDLRPATAPLAAEMPLTLASRSPPGAGTAHRRASGGAPGDGAAPTMLALARYASLARGPQAAARA